MVDLSKCNFSVRVYTSDEHGSKFLLATFANVKDFWECPLFLTYIALNYSIDEPLEVINVNVIDISRRCAPWNNQK